MIVRSHVAHAGSEMIFTGHALPWQFKKGSESFSRKLEKQVTIRHIPEPMNVVKYLRDNGYSIVAIEICEDSYSIESFNFPEKVALVLGNEAEGLPKEFIEISDYVVTIPQYAPVGSLNVAVSASIAMYELMRGKATNQISGDEYV